jgi:hypothetical protein
VLTDTWSACDDAWYLNAALLAVSAQILSRPTRGDHPTARCCPWDDASPSPQTSRSIRSTLRSSARSSPVNPPRLQLLKQRKFFRAVPCIPF